ncbi:MAG TPA: hybrid sensor histidine kinase/response regulator [Nannocystaceae bacterium]|nr:hybrid sensor histidine kinase/response regulator [Nannocystaceae bacterium]
MLANPATSLNIATPSLDLQNSMMTLPPPPTIAEPAILVVDDDARACFAMGEVLRSLGCRIVEAHSGDEALLLAAAQAFAIVLLDVRMPGLDGFATAQALREEGLNRQTPIIFLSAQEDAGDVRRAYAMGASDYPVKPFDPTVLLAKVDIFVSLHRRGEELRQRTVALREAELAAVLADEKLKSAEERNRLREVFIGVLGHDLRNPLGAIGMGAQLLLTQELPPPARVVVGKILASVTRMSALIRDVLDFARGELGGGIPIAPVDTNMAHVCQAVVEEHRMRTPEREIHLALHGNLRGRWDRERAEQALSNLISNAIQHGVGDLTVTARDDGEHVVVETHNLGPAIATDALATVFEPFRKADPSAQGLGLGLYIVFEIARAHGATIEVESSTERGTTFTIRWPRVPA